MERERFATLVGIDLGGVNGWIDRGYVPTVKISRHRHNNLAALTREAQKLKIARWTSGVVLSSLGVLLSRRQPVGCVSGSCR